jgi:rhamnosyltransferase
MTVCAIIVTYFPGDDFTRNLIAIRNQADHVIVFDNTPTSNLLISAAENLEIISKGANVGLAKALNFGLLEAKRNKFDWLIAFDQDSFPKPNMVDAMLMAFNDFPMKEKIRILAPKYISSDCDNNLMGRQELIPRWIERHTAITSGGMIKISNLGEDQLFDETLFIDGVDHNFCLQARERGELVLEVPTAVLIHNLGRPITKRVLRFFNVHTTNHNPIRHYYMTRNRLYLWSRYFMKFPLWVIRDFYAHIKMVVRVALFEDLKVEKLCCMNKGMIDFLRNKKGPIDG